MKRTALTRRTPLRARSKKMAARYVQRRRLVAELLADYPVCQVPWCDRLSEDVHEPLTRARGGSILDLENCRAVCRLHHDLIHLDQPEWAFELGFLRSSWDGSSWRDA